MDKHKNSSRVEGSSEEQAQSKKAISTKKGSCGSMSVELLQDL